MPNVKKAEFIPLLSDKNPSSTQKIQIFTRDIDFGSSGKMIDLKKVYVTYKGNATNIIGKFNCFFISSKSGDLNSFHSVSKINASAPLKA